ncbi:MAG: DUF3574 domain-containing protein [Leptolyngbya sp. ERB_1_1]
MKLKLRPVVPSLLLMMGLTLSFVVFTVPAQKAIVSQSDAQTFCEHQLHAKSFARTELLFGLSKPDKTVITESEFQHFIDQKVTPLFPDGLTLFGAAGQYKNDDEAVVKEGSKLLLLLYAANNESYRKIERIRQAYKTMFQQESVLRVDSRSCVSF